MSATSAPELAQETEENVGKAVASETTAEEVAVDTESETLTPALSQGEREEITELYSPPILPARLAERVRQSERLPAGLRTRLAELIEAGQSPDRFEAAVRAVEDALPGGLRGSTGDVRRASHPAGDSFFDRAGELSDDEAGEIARAQLARAGLLRGQRVRVGE
jgi:hypothetical protein